MPHSAFPDTDTACDVLAEFDAAVRDRPESPAIVHNGTTTITYQDLAERVSIATSRYGHADSAAMGHPVGSVRWSRTPAVAEHLLGILRAGAAYCPIDAALPLARKRALAATLGLDRLFAVAPDPRGPTDLQIETHDEEPVVADLPQPSWQQDDPAYVLCTSGSSGSPKPVVVSR